MLGDSQGTATIVDDEGLPVVSMCDTAVLEGAAGTTTVTFTVSLSLAPESPASVSFATANGTAQAPDDYTARPSTVLGSPPARPLAS